VGLLPGNSGFSVSLTGFARAEWESLQRERDPQLLQDALFSFARRQENSGNLEAAAQIYAHLDGQEMSPELRERSRSSLEAIQGRGTFGPRAEFLLRRLSQEAADPVSLAAMGLAGAVFRMTRLAVLSRLSLSPTAGFFTRGLGARAVAGLAGFALEAPAFTLSGRLGAEAMGHSQDWSPQVLGRDLASSFLVLGGLKLAGWGSGALYQRFGRGLGSPSATTLQALFQQGGMLGGILLGHGLERWAGLRTPSDRATTLLDSLALLLQFHVAGRLTQATFGEGFRGWELGLDRQIRTLEREPGVERDSWSHRLFPLRPATAASASPVFNAAMMATSSMDLSKSVGDADVVNPSTGIPELSGELLEYSTKIEKILRRVESRMRSKDYSMGDRVNLREKRPDPEDIDRLWFYQLDQILRRAPEIRAELRDAGALVEPLDPALEPPDASLLDLALRRLRSRGKEGSLARRVVELRIPRSVFSGQSNLMVATLSSLGVFADAQKQLGHRLHFMEDGTEEILIRIPSLSLYEKVLQAAFGRSSVQFHYVDGDIPRDDVMELRSSRVTPVGLSRHSLRLGDLGVEVLPFAFTVHDAIFHGVEDARALPGRPQFAGRLYDWLQKRRAQDAEADLMMTRLSDGEFGVPADMGATSFHRELLRMFSDEIGRLNLDSDLIAREERLTEMQRLARWLYPRLKPGSEASLAWQSWEDTARIAFQQNESEVQSLREGIERRYVSAISEGPRSPATLVYPPDLEATLQRLEARLGASTYGQGSREDLIASRPPLEDLDRLFLFQGRDYASRLPLGEYDEIDALEWAKIPTETSSEGGLALLQKAVELLGDRGEPGSEARRVLRITVPAQFLQLDIQNPQSKPWTYLSVVPPVLDVESTLQNRITFFDRNKGMIRYYYPSFSLSEALYQGAFGRDSVALFPVLGTLSRDQAARLRSLRLPPVGIGRDLIDFGDLGDKVHPFSFQGHDQYFHGIRDASQSQPYHELAAGWFYPRIQSYLPEHPIREKILDFLADLEFVPRSPWRLNALQLLILDPLRLRPESVAPLTQNPDAALGTEARSQLAEALRRLVIAEYRYHPLLAGKERPMVAALRDLQRPPALIGSRIR